MSGQGEANKRSRQESKTILDGDGRGRIFFRSMVPPRERLVEILRDWELSRSLRLELVDLSDSIDRVSRFLVVLVFNEAVETDDTLLRFVNYLESEHGDTSPKIVSDHIHDWISMVVGEGITSVYFVVVSGEAFSADADIEGLVAGEETTLKPPRDSKLVRGLLRPRMYLWQKRYLASHHFTNEQNEMIRHSMSFLLEWARSRRVLSMQGSDNGYLTRDILSMMLLVCVSRNVKSWTVTGILKSFFSAYSLWNYNEGSVGKDCCRASGGQRGSFIDETEGLDSEVDDNSSMSTPRRAEETASLGLIADDNDEVHPHKRLRYELGQIRDIRRYYEVDNTRVKKISMKENDEFSALDWLDVLSVMHPTEDVNLAVRILESHRKLIVQEMLRAHHIITDVSEVTDTSELLKPLAFRPAFSYIAFQVKADTNFILSTVASVIENQNWFLIQEVQAHAGLLVTPCEGYYKLKDGSTSALILTGITFVSEGPYSACEGLEVDLSGPMSRVLVRSRKILRDRADYATTLEKRFSVTCGVVRYLPQEWIDCFQ